MSSEGPETRLTRKMREAGKAKYGKRLVAIKYHGSPMSRGGVSDLLNCLDGVFVAVEVKAPESYGGSVERALEKGPSKRQREFVKDVIESGGVAGFAATIEQYMDHLRAAEEQAKEERG